MIVPESAIKYIKLQRTNYAKSDNIKDDFIADIHTDFDTIKDYLPNTVNNILDIGCGVAGIDVLFDKYYNKPNIFLLDKTENKTVFYGFNPHGSFYNSLNISESMLTENGCDKDRVHLIEATDDFDINTPPNLKFDIVMSFISWGFHYPIETYLPKVMDLLTDDGVVIIDLRNSARMKTLETYFDDVQKICQKNKACRVICKRGN